MYVYVAPTVVVLVELMKHRLVDVLDTDSTSKLLWFWDNESLEIDGKYIFRET